MGGKGLATRLLVEWDTTDYAAAMQLQHPVLDRVDVARHPTNPLLFMTGPYQASTVGSSGRAVVVTRSPLTDVYIDTYIGGNIGHVLRQAGWDGLFITGASEHLCRLEIVDGHAELHEATELQGMTTWQVEQRSMVWASVSPLDQQENMAYVLQVHSLLVEEPPAEVEPVLHLVSRISKR